MAYWRNNPYYAQSNGVIKPGDGINTYAPPNEIAKSEATRMLNMDSRNYPSISVRRGIGYFGSSTYPASTGNNSLGFRNLNTAYGYTMHVHDDITWKYYASSGGYVNVCTSAINAPSKILEYNTAATRYTCLADTSFLKYWDSTTLAASTQAPQTAYYTVDDYRLYALKDSILYCCAANDITDWTTADDADTIPISSIGIGTAIKAYNDMVICWGSESMHILYGNDPADFSLSDPIPTGCISDRSVIIHNNILYFMDHYKFMSFTGGTPVDVSQKVKHYLNNLNLAYRAGIVSTSFDKWILISVPYGSSVTENNLTLQYDTELQKWYVWNLGFKDFTTRGEYVYGVDNTGYIWRLNAGTNDGSTAVSWEVQFGVWDALPVRNRKTLSDIWALVDLPAISTMNIYYSTSFDSTSDWTLLKSFTGSADEQNTRVQIPTSALQGVPWYRIKIAGTGACTIHYLEPYNKVRRR